MIKTMKSFAVVKQLIHGKCIQRLYESLEDAAKSLSESEFLIDGEFSFDDAQLMPMPAEPLSLNTAVKPE